MWQAGKPAVQAEQIPEGSLLNEGAAMLAALARDLLAIRGGHLTTLRDTRLPALAAPRLTSHPVGSREIERQLVAECSAAADATVLIVPEFDNLLLERARIVESVGGRLVSPQSQFIQLAADKHETCQRLRKAGVAAAAGQLLLPDDDLPPSFHFPGVLKPVDGAGSVGVRLVRSRNEALNIARSGPMRLETFYSGLPASVAVLCGPSANVPLPPCEQWLSDDGHFTYGGGATPLCGPLAERAQQLALRAMAAMPATRGYVGIDMVLGDAVDGSRDVVIEINPRLTTSYVGLSRLCRGNLAHAMLQIAAGEATDLLFAADRIEFRGSDGGADIP